MRQFTFDGLVYNYFESCGSERNVEIPIAWHATQAHIGERVLEFGDVFSNHGRNGHHELLSRWGNVFDFERDILDKYDHRDSSIINQDIVDFHPAELYDFIVSVSTLEHVGKDDVEEKPPNDKKLLTAIDALLAALKPDGHMLITVPGGYNPVLDAMLPSLPFEKRFMIKRSDDFFSWEHVEYDEYEKVGIDRPFVGINGIAVLRK